MKIKIRVKDPTRQAQVIEALSANTVERFVTAMDEMEEVLVSRTEEIEALKLCIATKSHLMLEGPHGIAKSMLADEAMRRITGAKVFKKQFMKGTQTDEVLGPMNAKKYREEAIWEHNIAGMLPDCHFFYGDEIYRASDQCLPLMMGILNENEFINGGVRIQCPLITAIGTTNFVTDSEELEAFHDRWQVRVKSSALTAASDIRTMLSRALVREESSPSTVSLDEIHSINRAVRTIRIGDDILDVLPEVFQKYASAMSGIYISDRRKVQALKFMQAAALLSGKQEVEAEHIEGARFIITTVRDPAQAQAWANVVSTVLGEFQQSKAENKDLKKLEKLTRMLEEQFDPSMPERKMKELWDQARNTLAAINGARPDQKPTSQRGIERMDVVKRKLEELCQSIAQQNVF